MRIRFNLLSQLRYVLDIDSNVPEQGDKGTKEHSLGEGVACLYDVDYGILGMQWTARSQLAANLFLTRLQSL
jgi:hypothetical protein